jgi:hypothetical protein
MTTWHDLTKGEQSTLVSIGLDGRKRLHKDNERGLSLLDKDLTEVLAEENTARMYILTNAGRQVLLDAPIETGADIFPLSSHMEEVKRLLRSANAES